MPVRFASRSRLDRIDDDQLCTVVLGFGDERPMVQIGADGIARPQNNVFRMLEALWIHAGRGAYRHKIGGARTRVAERPFAYGSPELVKERVSHIETVEDTFST